MKTSVKVHENGEVSKFATVKTKINWKAILNADFVITRDFSEFKVNEECLYDDWQYMPKDWFSEHFTYNRTAELDICYLVYGDLVIKVKRPWIIEKYRKLLASWQKILREVELEDEGE